MMATFKVGQRVRKVATPPTGQRGWMWPAHIPLGAEGTVVAIPGAWANAARDDTYCIHYDCMPVYPCAALGSMIAPLTDPKADQFIEWVKKIKPEPVAVPVRQGTPIWK